MKTLAEQLQVKLECKHLLEEIEAAQQHAKTKKLEEVMRELLASA